MHRFCYDNALQLGRHRSNGEFDVLEFLPRFGPLPLTRVGQRLPQLRIVVGSGRRIGEIFQPLLGTAAQDARDRVHHQRGSILTARLDVRQHEIGNGLGFRVHPARHIETRKIHPGLGALIGLGCAGGRHQFVLPRGEIALLILAPLAVVENGPHRGWRALRRDVSRRQRQAAGPAEHDLVGCNLCGDIIGVRMYRDAVDRLQQRQLDKILPLDEAANGRRRRDHHKHVAGVRIDKAMQKAGPGQRYGDVGKRRIGDIAYRQQRLRRRLHRIGECDRPVCSARAIVARQRWYLRAVEANADRLPVVQRQPADVGDDRPSLAADRLDIERFGGIEHQPHGIGATKQCRRRSGGE